MVLNLRVDLLDGVVVLAYLNSGASYGGLVKLLFALLFEDFLLDVVFFVDEIVIPRRVGYRVTVCVNEATFTLAGAKLLTIFVTGRGKVYVFFSLLR